MIGLIRFLMRVVTALSCGEEIRAVMRTEMPRQQVATGSEEEEQQRQTGKNAVAVSGDHESN